MTTARLLRPLSAALLLLILVPGVNAMPEGPGEATSPLSARRADLDGLNLQPAPAVPVAPAGNATSADLGTPMAASTGEAFPERIAVHTRRDAGSQPVPALEIQADPLVTRIYGTVADTTTFTLPQDPTWDWGPAAPVNGMYDDLSQVFVMTMTVPANALYVAVEVLETSARDLDMALGYDANGDGTPEAAEEIATAGDRHALDTLFLDGPRLQGLVTPAVYAEGGTYWILVMNREASQDGAADTVKLATAAVSAGDLESRVALAAPASTGAGAPFTATLTYDLDPIWDAWYGVTGFYSDTTPLRTVPTHLTRHPDAVTKTVQDWTAGSSGLTVTYALTIAANVTGQDLTTTLTDTIPVGMTLIPGTLTGGATVDGNRILWSAPQTGAHGYRVSDSLSDPVCYADGGYVDLRTAKGYAPLADIHGDSEAWTVFGTEAVTTTMAFNFFGKPYTGTTLLDDGITVFDWAHNGGGKPWENQEVPTSTLPNNLIAAFWKDLQIRYDPDLNYGVTLAADPDGGLAIIELDDVIPYGGDGSEHYDLEYWIWANPGPGPEIRIEYGEMVGPVTDVTVGVENADGMQGHPYTTPDRITDGLGVCFDWGPLSEPHTITYQVTVARPGTYTSAVQYVVDNPGAKVAAVETTFHWTQVALPLVLRP